MANDLVSVVVPVFNCRDYLARCLDSALAQTHRPIEVIAVDDGSTDGSSDILFSYGSRIRVVTQENSGPSAARNNGIAKATGDYVAFLDGDDIWDARKTEVQLAAMKLHPEALAVYCDHRSIDAGDLIMGVTGALDHPRSSGKILEDLIRGQRIKSPSLVMARRDALNAVGGFDPALRYSEDYDLWLRLATRGPILYQLDTLASYRVHGGNVSLTPGSDLKALEGNLLALEKLVSQGQALESNAIKLTLERLHSIALDLGWARRRSGARRGAARAYWRALKMRPGSCRAWAGLIWSMFSGSERTSHGR